VRFDLTHMGPYGLIWAHIPHMVPICIWAHMGRIWAHMGSIWAHMVPNGAISPYGIFNTHMDHMGPIWAHMGPIWAHMGPYGSIWAHVGPIWANMDPYVTHMDQPSADHSLSAASACRLHAPSAASACSFRGIHMWPQQETPNRAYRIYIGNKIQQNPQPPKIGKNLYFLSYMAVWPDPAHGKCSSGNFNMLIFQKSDIFENMIVHYFLDYDFGSGLMKTFLWTMGSF